MDTIDKNVLKAIDPKRDPKYSASLHKFLKKNPECCHVYDGNAESCPDVMYDKARRRCFFIGYMDEKCFVGDYHAADMATVICRGGRTLVNVYVQTTDKSEPWPEIENFWDEYVRIGKCAVDPQHIVYTEDARYELSADGESRKCRWCGKTFVKKETVVTRIVTSWVEAPTAL